MVGARSSMRMVRVMLVHSRRTIFMVMVYMYRVCIYDDRFGRIRSVMKVIGFETRCTVMERLFGLMVFHYCIIRS